MPVMRPCMIQHWTNYSSGSVNLAVVKEKSVVQMIEIMISGDDIQPGKKSIRIVL